MFFWIEFKDICNSASNSILFNQDHGICVTPCIPNSIKLELTADFIWAQVAGFHKSFVILGFLFSLIISNSKLESSKDSGEILFWNNSFQINLKFLLMSFFFEKEYVFEKLNFFILNLMGIF